MIDRRTENARTLASLLGVEPKDAAERLDCAVLLRADPTDAIAMRLAEYLRELLSRTITEVTINITPAMAATEVLVGGVDAHHQGGLRVQVSDVIQIGSSLPAERISPTTHPILLLIAACYAAGMVMKTLFGPALQVPGAASTQNLDVPVSTLVGTDARWLAEPFELNSTYLAGAGAIGNGFVKALSFLPASGNLSIVDPDIVSDGNLNRCVWFTSADLGLSKADRLAALAQPLFAHASLHPEAMTLQELSKGQASEKWLERLVVAVDSRRARRHLQLETPHEVFDASTTGAVECVFHHHRQPTEQACLACIYHDTADEQARERHIANAIGVELADVMKHFVSAEAAQRIHARYPNVPVNELTGRAYDSLFKAICSEGALISPEERHVLAPFAFVSVFAGALLALDLQRRLIGVSGDEFNYWRVSPWAAPVVELKAVRGRTTGCVFCSQTAFLRTAQRLWG